MTSGCENSGNLRELALNRMKDFGAVCRDVRFREVGVSVYFCIYGIARLPHIYIYRFMKFITKFALNPLNFFEETIQRMVAGKLSFPMRTPKKTF